MSDCILPFIYAGTVEGELINQDGSIQRFGPEPNMVVYDSAFALAWILKQAVAGQPVSFYIALGDLGDDVVTNETPELVDLPVDKALSQDQFHLYRELSGGGNSRVVARSVDYSLDETSDPPESTIASVDKGGTTISNKLTITTTFVEQATGVIRECGLFVGPGAELTPGVADIANHCAAKGGIMISRKIITPGAPPFQKATQSTLNIRWRLFIASPTVPT